MNNARNTVTEPVRVDAPPVREARPRGVLCPFCGEVSPDVRQCRGCRAFLDPLSRQASQNEMGPWFIRDPAHPFRPGCSFETIRRMIKRGMITATTVIRGPATRQAWSFAGRCPSVGNLLGLCHNCQREVSAEAFSCRDCGASFAPELDRQHLGLAPVHLLPGQAAPEAIASAVSPPSSAARAPVAAAPVVPAPAPTRPAPVEVAAEVVPVRVHDGAAMAALRRWRLGAAALLVIVILLAAALAVVASGVRLDWLGAPTAAQDKSGSAAPSAQPAEINAGQTEATEAPPSEGAAEPSDPAPEPSPAASDGAEARPVDPAPPPGLSLADEILPLIAREPIDVGAVRASVAGRPGADEWVFAAERRAELLRLRTLP